MTKLIVSLPHTGAAHAGSSAVSGNTLYSFVLTTDDQRDDVSRAKTGVLGLSNLPKADATVLVVPARAISWHQVNLAKIPKARLRAALDGLLEEHLLDDTSDMAFALSPDAQAGKASVGAWVAACDKAWLNHAVQTFDTAGYRITQVVPEFWPQSNPMVSVTGSPEDAWVTRADSNGVMTVPLHAGDTSGVLQALLAQLPASASIGAEPAVMALAEASLLPYPDLKVQLRPQAAGLLHSATSVWEMAQFEQSLSGDSQGMKNTIRQWQSFWHSPAWRPARWGLLALLCANIVGLNAWAWQQQTSLSKKRAQLGTILTQSFPHVKTVVDPNLQMSREMALLRQATGANSVQNFEPMLSTISSVNSTETSVFTTVTAIEYIANNGNYSVNIKTTPLNAAALATTQEKIKPMGYVLTQNGDATSLKVQTAP